MQNFNSTVSVLPSSSDNSEKVQNLKNFDSQPDMETLLQELQLLKNENAFLRKEIPSVVAAEQKLIIKRMEEFENTTNLRVEQINLRVLELEKETKRVEEKMKDLVRKLQLLYGNGNDELINFVNRNIGSL